MDENSFLFFSASHKDLKYKRTIIWHQKAFQILNSKHASCHGVQNSVYSKTCAQHVLATEVSLHMLCRLAELFMLRNVWTGQKRMGFRFNQQTTPNFLWQVNCLTRQCTYLIKLHHLTVMLLSFILFYFEKQISTEKPIWSKKKYT